MPSAEIPVQWSDDDREFTRRRAAPRNVKLAEQVARDIAEGIFTRNLVAGARLPSERLMLDRFGVSRGTLREALRILEMQGLIVVRAGPGGGPVVVSMTPEDFNRVASLHYKSAAASVRDLWKARMDIEPVLARRAAEELTPETTKTLTDLLERSRHTTVDNDGDFIRVGSTFHRVIAYTSGNPILDLMARSLGEMTAYLESAAVFPPESRDNVHRDHQAIVKAILAGNAKRAERLMRDHMAEMLASHAQRFPGSLDSLLPYVI